MGDGDNGRKVIASNRRARYEYEILDTFEAGIVLLGSEVKSLRAGKASLGDAYAEIRRGELYLLNARALMQMADARGEVIVAYGHALFEGEHDRHGGGRRGETRPRRHGGGQSRAAVEDPLPPLRDASAA